MKKNLKKRIYTSFILFLLAVFAIMINEWVFTFSILVALFFCYSEWININSYYFKRKKKSIFNSYSLIKFYGFIYLSFVFFSAVSIRSTTFEGGLFFTFIILVCVGSDVGGYLFGKLFSGPKLTKISPNKTISGSLGSFILSLVPILLINLQDFYVFNFILNFKNILFCLFISLVCQLGDLFISYFKRLNKVKDTGKILPGHGGILDRVDGIIFVIPFIYFLSLAKFF
jgi:phosphatidate cytidylyltransferase